MIAALFIFNAKGDVLMSKIYRGGVKRNISDVFRIQVINSRTVKEIRSPILTLGSTSFIYRQLESIWICAVTRSNQDCTAILEFLNKFEPLLKVVLGDGQPLKQLTEEKIINNFIVIYELLDEVIEFGFPINLELTYLKNHLTTLPGKDNLFKLPTTLKTSRSMISGSNINNNGTNNSNNGSAPSSVSWRNEGIKYRRNEIFLNVHEKVNVLMNYNSEVLRAYVDGTINMKTHLSGMPECRFGFTDNCELLGSNKRNPESYPGDVIIEDSKFHQCVQLPRFDSLGDIQFIPPDGEFQLMSYRSTLNITLPFKIFPQIEISNLKIVYNITVKAQFTQKLPATNVQIKIPTPKGVINNNSISSGGKCKFHPEDNMFIWKFNKFLGEQEYSLTSEVELSQNLNSPSTLNWTKPPIKLEFNLEMFNASGLTVKFLKVMEKAGYRTVKWVKYETQSGSYEFRY